MTTASNTLAMRCGALAVASSLLLLVPADGNAQRRLERGVDVAVGYGESDNVGRTEPPGGRGSFHSLGLSFDLHTERPRFTSALVGDAELRNYSEPVVAPGDDNETYGSVDGLAVFAAVPERFDWEFALASGQVRTDPFGSSSVDNRERITVVSTGPTVNLPLGERTSLGLTGRVAERGFEDSSFLDNEVVEVGVAFERVLSTVSSLGFEIESTDVEFDLSAQGYKFESAYIAYRKEFASGGVELRIGSGDVSFAVGDSESQGLGSIRWDRAVGSRSRFGFWASRELTDPSGVFTTGGIPGLADLAGEPSGVSDAVDLGQLRLQEVILSAGPMERDGVGVAFVVTGERTAVTLTGGLAEEDYLASDRTDNDSNFVEFGIDRDFSSRWSGEVRLRRVQQEFVRDGTEGRESWGTVSIGRRFSDRGRVDLEVQSIARDGELDPSDEMLYIASFRYGLVR